MKKECFGEYPDSLDLGCKCCDFEDGCYRETRLKKERSGERNIVIGNEGEHEVNSKWTMQQAYEHLANTCEMCGGLVVKDGLSQLLLMKTYGPSFVIEWMHGKLYQISERRHITRWIQK